MRLILVLIMAITLIGSASAIDLGNHSTEIKSNSHVGMNPGTPDNRQGGDTIDAATFFAALPYTNNGNTCNYNDDYDAVCPYEGSTSPDVVYSFTPSLDMSITIDMDGSGYDTKIYILDADLNIIACNDDSHLPGYVSFLERVDLVSGVTYYIVIDGYGGDCGDYIMNVYEYYPPTPCILTCDGFDENEPPLEEGYEDLFNGGCNSANNSFTHMDFWPCGSYGDLTFCGNAGWYISPDGSEYRDTDWLVLLVGYSGVIQWTLDAEYETVGYLLNIPDCDNVTVSQSMGAGPCSPATMTIEAPPLTLIYLFVGASTFTAPYGFDGNEYAYTCEFVGLYNSAGATSTESVSFDKIKSLYR